MMNQVELPTHILIKCKLELSGGSLSKYLPQYLKEIMQRVVMANERNQKNRLRSFPDPEILIEIIYQIFPENLHTMT